jgi:uncharacterized membrane protein
MTEIKHPRHDFMIERIAFFSDAVFAIAITLLAIEIHPPLVKRGETAKEAWYHFTEIIPELIGLLVSFWLIGSVWLRHHQLFKFVDNFDTKFMVINLWLLFTIILFPFSTGFLFNSIFNGGVVKLQVFCYLGVPLCSNIIMYIMYKKVNRKHLKSTADINFQKSFIMQVALIVSFMLVITWVAVMPVQYHAFGYTFFAAIPLISNLYKKKLNKK